MSDFPGYCLLKPDISSRSTLVLIRSFLQSQPEPGKEPCKAPPPAGSEYKWWMERTLEMNRLGKNLRAPIPSSKPSSSSARNHTKGPNSLASAGSTSLMAPRSVKCPGLRRQSKQVTDE